MTTERPADQLLGIADIAEAVGLTQASVATYHTDAKRRRRNGTTLPQDMPEPDQVIGRTPAWKWSTVQAWLKAREEAGQRNLARLRSPRGKTS